MPEKERIVDHAFVPQTEDQLSDACAYEGCGKREVEHEWTVDAERANPREGSNG